LIHRTTDGGDEVSSKVVKPKTGKVDQNQETQIVKQKRGVRKGRKGGKGGGRKGGGRETGEEKRKKEERGKNWMRGLKKATRRQHAGARDPPRVWIRC